MRKYLIILIIFITIPLFSYGKTIIKSTGKVISITPSSITNGLVGYWTFDGKDVVNGVAKDVSGNGNNGNLVNIATSTFYAKGKIGQGFNFDGVNDYVNAGNAASVQPGQNYTMSAWFKPSGFGSFRYMVAYGGAGSGASSGMAIEESTSGGVNITLRANTDTGPETVTSGFPMKIGVWYHAVAIRSGATFSLYVNGSFFTSITIDTGAITDSTGLVIGNSKPLDPANTWNGLIDDVRIYNRVLSAIEVKQLYNNGLTTIKSNI